MLALAAPGQWRGQGEETVEVWVCRVPAGSTAAEYGQLPLRLDLTAAAVAAAVAPLTSYFDQLSLGAYRRWGFSLLLGLFALCLGAVTAADQVEWLALSATQLAAYVRYASRGAWLASALGSVSGERRLGSSTRNTAPLPSSAFPAEMVPP